MPALEGLNKKYAGKSVTVVGLLLDPSREQWAREIVKETGTSFPHLKDDGRFGQRVFGVPQTIVVDSSGKILSVLVGKRSLDQLSNIAEDLLKL